MSDIFQEVDNELRRDRLQRLWDQNGLVIITAAIGIVIAVTLGVGYNAWRSSVNEAASERYAVLIEEISALDPEEAQTRLQTFLSQEDNGYGVLASFRLAESLFASGDVEGAARGYEAIATRGDLPPSIRDFASIMAASVLVGKASAADIEARLSKVLANANGLQGQAREVLALALLLDDEPLAARDLLQRHLAETALTKAMALRAQILLDEALLKLRVSAE